MEKHGEATSRAAAAATATTRPSGDDDEDEMPLLFMDNLPSDFQRNALLAALVTFMGSDEEGGDDSGDEVEGKVSAVTQRRATRRKNRNPYARSEGENKTTEEKKIKKRDNGANELSLYLSMFNVSKE